MGKYLNNTSNTTGQGVCKTSWQSCTKTLQITFLGPHVSQANFEVQKDLISALERANFDTSKALVEKKQSFYLSLRELCRQKLDNFSVEIINKESECSYEKKDKFFSFRRAKAKTSNNITFTWL